MILARSRNGYLCGIDFGGLFKMTMVARNIHFVLISNSNIEIIDCTSLFFCLFFFVCVCVCAGRLWSAQVRILTSTR